jgi:hypothetical protein
MRVREILLSLPIKPPRRLLTAIFADWCIRKFSADLE